MLDPVPCDWSDKTWDTSDWLEFYPDAQEVIPPNAPEPHGKCVQMNVFMDAAHATDVIMWHSVTGILIYLMGAPIWWFSK